MSVGLDCKSTILQSSWWQEAGSAFQKLKVAPCFIAEALGLQVSRGST